ncbi:MAG: hypothetical protein AAF598_19220 [Bacteroidota bacterium]
MFWKRKPKSPITPEDQNWVETSLDWINRKVVRLKKQPTIEPSPAFFDRDFTGSEEDARYVLEQCGEYFQIKLDDLELHFYEEAALKLDPGLVSRVKSNGAAGLYRQGGGIYEIWLEQKQLQRPEALVATMAHELSHYLLMGQKGIYIKGEENEWITDLVTIAYGFGIFTGNAKFSFQQWQSGDGWGGWSSSKKGYLPLPVIAYAMADIECRKGKQDLPTWMQHLNRDLKSDFKQSFRYIQHQRQGTPGLAPSDEQD